MKSIKKMMIAVISILFVTLGFTSCNSDDNNNESWSYSFGVLEKSGTNWLIHTDLGNTLIVDSYGPNINSNILPEIEGRVYVTFIVKEEIIREPKGITYKIQLNTIYGILTKDALTLSKMTEEEKLAVGDDPIGVRDVWFSEDYLNIEFIINVMPVSSTKHFINLEYDDVNFDDGKYHLFLKHNAYGEDNLNFWARGYVSFDLNKLVGADATNVDIVLGWKWYDGFGGLVNNRDEGIFRPSGQKNKFERVLNMDIPAVIK